MKRPKVGELAIARFDGNDEVVCVVLARSKTEFKFMYFSSVPGGVKKTYEIDELPCNRLRHVLPKAIWRGSCWNLRELTPDEVIDAD